MEEKQLAIISYRILVNLPSSKQAIDLSLGTVCNCLRLLAGSHIKPRSAYLSRDKTENNDIYSRILGTTVIYNHELNAVVFDRHLLDSPLQNHNQAIQKLLKRNLESTSREFESDIIGEVRKLIVNLLPFGYCTLELVAKQLMMSPRKLQYQLATEDTTFKEIVDQVRIGIAQQQLRQSKIPLSQLCETLGYSDQTAFSRAFKRWFGISPRGWKKQHAK